MNSHITILKLVYRGSGWLLKLSFLALPLALFISISSYLFMDNLLGSYRHYLVKSYVGVQGRISVESSSFELIKDLKNFAQRNQLHFSEKKAVKSNVVLVSDNERITKNAQFVFLDHNYLRTKFEQPDKPYNTLFVNTVFSKSMGTKELNTFKQIYFDDDTKLCNIDSVVTVDTGFLGNRPIIYISWGFGRELMGDQISNGEEIEFLEMQNSVIAKIKAQVNALAQKHQALEVKIHDLIEDTASTQNFFKKVFYIQLGLSILIFILSLGVVVLSIAISIEFKKNALNILHLVGMSRRELAQTLSGSIFLMMLAVAIVGFGIVGLYRRLFLERSGFSVDFFIPVELANIGILALLAMVITLIVYWSVSYIFKGIE